LQIIEKVGFVDVKAEDKTEMFKDVIKRELQKTETIKDDFIKVSLCCSCCLLAALVELGLY